MTHFELYNQVKDMESVVEIKKVIKKALLEELAGEDFTIREQKKIDEREIKIRNLLGKEVRAFEKKEKRKITREEKSEVKKKIVESVN